MEHLDTDVQEVLVAFATLLDQLETRKPNDRSKQDRYWAITITEVEKAYALFATFAGENGEK